MVALLVRISHPSHPAGAHRPVRGGVALGVVDAGVGRLSARIPAGVVDAGLVVSTVRVVLTFALGNW